MIKKTDRSENPIKRLISPIRSHYTYCALQVFVMVIYIPDPKVAVVAPKRCRSKTSVVLWSMEAFPPRRSAIIP